MAVRDGQHTLKRVAGSGPAIDVEAHLDVVEIVDSPAGTLEGELEFTAGALGKDDAALEWLRGAEYPQYRLAGGLQDNAKRVAAGAIDEVRAQEKVILARDTRRRGDRDVAQGCRSDLNSAFRPCITASHRRGCAAGLQERGGEQESARAGTGER